VSLVFGFGFSLSRVDCFAVSLVRLSRLGIGFGPLDCQI